MKIKREEKKMDLLETMNMHMKNRRKPQIENDTFARSINKTGQKYSYGFAYAVLNNC